MKTAPDCCPAPDLEMVRLVYGPPGPERVLKRCRACGAHWRYDVVERMNFDGGGDDCWEYYSPLTDGEAAALRETPPQ